MDNMHHALLAYLVSARVMSQFELNVISQSYIITITNNKEVTDYRYPPPVIFHLRKIQILDFRIRLQC